MIFATNYMKYIELKIISLSKYVHFDIIGKTVIDLNATISVIIPFGNNKLYKE